MLSLTNGGTYLSKKIVEIEPGIYTLEEPPPEFDSKRAIKDMVEAIKKIVDRN